MLSKNRYGFYRKVVTATPDPGELALVPLDASGGEAAVNSLSSAFLSVKMNELFQQLQGATNIPKESNCEVAAIYQVIGDEIVELGERFVSLPEHTLRQKQANGDINLYMVLKDRYLIEATPSCETYPWFKFTKKLFDGIDEKLKPFYSASGLGVRIYTEDEIPTKAEILSLVKDTLLQNNTPQALFQLFRTQQEVMVKLQSWKYPLHQVFTSQKLTLKAYYEEQAVANNAELLKLADEAEDKDDKALLKLALTQPALICTAQDKLPCLVLAEDRSEQYQKTKTLEY